MSQQRKIVAFSYLSEVLDIRGCVECNTPLKQIHSESKTVHGLGMILAIRCEHCKMINDVATGKQHHNTSKKRTKPVFDIYLRQRCFG